MKIKREHSPVFLTAKINACQQPRMTLVILSNFGNLKEFSSVTLPEPARQALKSFAL